MIALGLALIAAQSASGEGDNLQRASARAIVAAGKACVGATTDPAGEDARLTGWSDATDTQKAGMKTEGRVLIRDNVVLVVKTGIDGGCVVQAKTAPEFDQPAFIANLSAAIGAQVVVDPANPVTTLPNGEILVTQVGGGFAMLVIANPNGKYAKKYQGKVKP